MPRLIALEWDNSEARIAVGRVRKGHVDLDHALTVPFKAEARKANDHGGVIKQALQSLSVSGGEVLVAVSRSSIELRFLSVPPVPPDELPDLVRFQASRQFSQPIEEGLLDYAPLESSGTPPTSVLAAAISPDLLKTIRETCEAAGLSLKHLVLRPFAADSLVVDKLSADSCILTIDRLSEEIDLTVVVGEQAVFPRTVRVSSHGTAEEQATSIVAEIRRTMAASSNQLAGKRVEKAILFGRAVEQPALAEHIKRELSLEVEFVDPLETVSLSESLQRQPPAFAGRFAPLVGMLVDESKSRRHEIDFLAPRCRPPPADHKRLYSLIGGVAAALFLAVAGTIYWQLSSLETEIQDLTDQINDLDKGLKKSKTTLEHAKLLDEFAAGQVTWLNELREIAVELPPADKVIIRELKTNVGKTEGAKAGTGPTIILQGNAKTSEDITVMEARLRDDRHRISGDGGNEVDDKNYPWLFNETVTVLSGDQVRANTAKQPASTPGAKTSPASSTSAVKGKTS